MKIAICGLVKSENLGKRFIAETLASIINEFIGSGHTFTFVDITAKGYPSNRSPLGASLYGFFGGVANHLHLLSLKNVCYYFRHLVFLKSNCFRKRLDKYFNDSFYGVDVIVVDGAGLLEYSWNEYQEYLLAISEWGGDTISPLCLMQLEELENLIQKITDARCCKNVLPIRALNMFQPVTVLKMFRNALGIGSQLSCWRMLHSV